MPGIQADEFDIATRVRTGAGCRVEGSIIMDYTKVKSGARVKRVIVDRYNTIEAGQRIGYEVDADRRQRHVTDPGIVIVSKGTALRERRAFLLTRVRKQ